MGTYYSYSSEFDCPAVYKITVRGKIDFVCLNSSEDMTVNYQTLEDGSINTIFTGLLVDQAALNGVLNTIRLLRLTLVSVAKDSDCI